MTDYEKIAQGFMGISSFEKVNEVSVTVKFEKDKQTTVSFHSYEPYINADLSLDEFANISENSIHICGKKKQLEYCTDALLELGMTTTDLSEFVSSLLICKGDEV